MRIAVASDGLDVSLHGDRCESYTCYTVDRGIITQCQNTPNPCLPPNLTADLLKQLGVSVFVVHVLDPKFRGAFERAGIDVVTGAFGSAHRAVEDCLASMLLGDDGSLDDERLFEGERLVDDDDPLLALETT